MSIEIRDKRNMNTIPLGNLKSGDAFMSENKLFLVMLDQKEKVDWVSCVLLSGGQYNARISHLNIDLLVQQVSLTIEVHLV